MNTLLSLVHMNIPSEFSVPENLKVLLNQILHTFLTKKIWFLLFPGLLLELFKILHRKNSSTEIGSRHFQLIVVGKTSGSSKKQSHTFELLSAFDRASCQAFHKITLNGREHEHNRNGCRSSERHDNPPVDLDRTDVIGQSNG